MPSIKKAVAKKDVEVSVDVNNSTFTNSADTISQALLGLGEKVGFVKTKATLTVKKGKSEVTKTIPVRSFKKMINSRTAAEILGSKFVA